MTEGYKPPLYAPDMPEITAQALVGEIKQKFETAARARRIQDRQWWLNLAHIVGKQWMDFNLQQMRIIQPLALPGRFYLVSNMIFIAWRKLVAQLVGPKPIIAVYPNEKTQSSKNAADVATKILKGLDSTSRMEGVKSDVANHLISFGNAFCKVYYDAESGEAMEIPDVTEEPTPLPAASGDGTQMLSDSGAPLFQRVDDEGNPVFRTMRKGEVRIDSMLPHEFYPDPAARDFDHMVHCFHTKAVTPDYVWKRYGVMVDAKGGLDADPLSPESMLMNMQGGTPSEHLADSVWLLEYWERPSHDNPQGKRAVVCQNKLLLCQKELPYPDVPFIQFRAIRVPGRFWGMSPIEQAIPLQREYNKGLSDILTIRDRMSNQKFMVALQAGIDLEAFSDSLAEVILYNASGVGQPIIPLQTPNLPAHFFETVIRARQDLFEIMATWDSQTRPNVRSGIGISRLQEDMESQNIVMMRDYEEAWERVGKSYLWGVENFYTEPRKVKIVGHSGLLELQDFRGEDIAGHYDVHVKIGTGLPQSRVMRQEFVFRLMQMGLATNPRKILEVLDIEEYSEILTQLREDEAQAEQENEDMMGGQPVSVNDWDNHMVHLDTVNSLLKQRHFRALPKEIQESIQFHRQTHVAAMANNPALQQQFYQAALAGSPLEKAMNGGPPGGLGERAAAGPRGMSAPSLTVQEGGE